MQVFVKNTDVLASLLTDHANYIFILKKMRKAIEVEAFGNLIKP